MPCSEDMTPSGGCCSRGVERIDRCAPCAIAVLAVGPPSSRGATRLTEGTRNRKDRPQAVDGVEANSYIEVTEVASDRSRRPRKLVKSVTRAAFSGYRSAPTPWLPGQRPANGPVGRFGEGVHGSVWYRCRSSLQSVAEAVPGHEHSPCHGSRMPVPGGAQDATPVVPTVFAWA